MGNVIVSEKTSQKRNSTNSFPRFIHLRIHSAYSLLEGALKTKQIIQHAVSDSAPAIAITDTNNLFGALEFSQYCFAEGIQPIIGCQLTIDFGDADCNLRLAKGQHPSNFSSIVLFAASETGYAHLVRLVSRAYLDKSDTDPPHINVDWLEQQSEGIIALTGGRGGPINLALEEDKKDRAVKRLTDLKKIFGDCLYVELQRHGSYNQKLEAELIELAYEHEIPLVATNEAFFLDKAGYEAHDALMAVAEGQIVSNPERKRVTPDHYLKSQDEMVSLFSDLPEALENSVEIALRCHAFTPIRKPILPRFIEQSTDSISDLAAEDKELLNQAKAGLKMRLETSGLATGYMLADYEQRLDYEISVITRMQFSGYFLIVSDFIKWAKSQDIPVGPGRGSGAGSLVAYALTITDIDPLRFSLLFERFLNPDRVSMPDFDIDFCQDRREEVIRYVQKKYGRDQVAQIITFGKLQARAVLRDVGRVLEVPYRQVDYLTKLVPATPGSHVELAMAIKDEPKFAEEKKKDPVIGRMLDIALQLEGLYRHASTHAAGIVIGDRPLSDLVPMYRDPRSEMPVTQFNMKHVEQAGLVKFDFLGLKTLTVLKKAVHFVSRKDPNINLSNIPLDDEATYAMMARGETVGVFQVESAGMRKALIGMKPDCIEDIIALVALYRPGPMENIPTYNARKHGEEEIASIHPKIDHLVKETQGVIVYQEQVMQIAQVLSGYSLGEADLLRRAMGKKIHEEMQKQRARFVSGAVEGGLDKGQADTIFDLLAKFADYGFNKSHAAAYAIVSYQTAYMKAHHPVEFLAASMTYDMTNTDKLNDFRQEALRLGIEVIAPCVQTSHRVFEVGENCIYYSLAAIKGVGEAAVDHIVERRGNKSFKDMEDFCKRIDFRIVNKRAMESLIYAGALDCFNIAREVLLENLDIFSARSMRILDNNLSGQTDMFGEGRGELKEPLILSRKVSPWYPAEKLHHEFQVIGFYFSAHPLDEYQAILAKKHVQTWSHFANAVKEGAITAILAGTVVAKQIRKTKSGKKMGVVQFSDTSGQYEALLFSEGMSLYGDILEPGKSFIVTVSAENRSEGVDLRIEEVQSLEDEALRPYKMMRLFIKTIDILPKIEQNLSSDGNGEVRIVLSREKASQEIEVVLPKRYKVNLRIASIMKMLHGVFNVELN
ncbi:DNA polymerase III subunit alpha [Bartonella sp. A5(2022)]|nr:DNA polymerase III subunit alpha [Bartonella sp. A05]MCZ2204382.1 DNA polymerase III subunit alpha [Bartonella sp. A05]